MSKFDEVYKKLIYESTATDIIEDDLNCEYYKDSITISDFLRSKIERLNTL